MNNIYSEIEILPFDDLEQNKYLIIYKNLKYKTSSKLLIYIIEYLKNGYSLDYISNELKIEYNYLNYIKEKYIDKLFEKRRRKNFLFLQIKIFSSKFFLKIANCFRILFRPKFLFFFSLLNLIFLIIFLFISIKEKIFSFNLINLIKLLDWKSLLLIFISINLKGIIHEIGHMSALKYYGYDSTEIGFGVYLSFFIFYVNLDESWRLSRKERIIVDIGGIFFEFLFLTSLTIIYLAFRKYNISKNLLLINFLIISSIIYNLFPFFKFDGYWIISDYFGISDLQEKIPLYLKNLVNFNKNYNKNREKVEKEIFEINNLSITKKIFLIIYMLFYIPVFFYVIYLIINFLYYSLSKLPTIISKILFLSFYDYLELITTVFIIIGIISFISKKLIFFLLKKRKREKNV